jgi:hypothetical protein
VHNYACLWHAQGWRESRVLSVYEVCVQGRFIGAFALVLVFLQSAYANGGHIHVEGIFFLLLGGLIFLGGLCVVVYFLLRPHPEDADEPHDQD